MWSKKFLNLNYTTKMMTRMEKGVKRFKKQRQDESNGKYISSIGKNPSYPKSLMNQKQRLSPTSKHPSKSFSRISENKSNDKFDLENILYELEND